MLIVDTGVIVAAADRSDRHHSAPVLLEEATGPLVTSPLVVAEAAYLINRELGSAAEESLFTAIVEGALVVESLTAAD
ncbi:hypothetical protein GCM10009682_22320 [Luedemannella flava]|uniref:PIN domain-containing protein n=1 Tax=Luedemannella flava TaxID=349316 RepID=A0ABP4Y6T0_9ACTN